MDKDRIQGYYTHMARRGYDLSMALDEIVGIRKKFFRALDIQDGSQVLEVAVGTGRNFGRYNPNAEHVGIDLNREMLEVAEEKLGLFPNVTLMQANAERLPFDEGEFDCAFVTYGFSAMRNQCGAIHEMKRVVKPGGIVGVLDFLYHSRKDFSKVRGYVAGTKLDLRFLLAPYKHQLVHNRTYKARFFGKSQVVAIMKV